MRYIQKGYGAYAINSKTAPISAVAARRAWSNVDKLELKRVCLYEQKGLCGYSEISIERYWTVSDEDFNLGSHFEHIKPISLFPETTFEHTNIILNAICNSSQKNLRREDVFGGKAKLSWYEPLHFVSPTDPDCEKYFHYSTTGTVSPKTSLNDGDRLKAAVTIDKLNLNAPHLVSLRRTWLQELDKLIVEINDSAAIKEFAELELTPMNDRLRPFHSAQKQIFGL